MVDVETPIPSSSKDATIRAAWSMGLASQRGVTQYISPDAYASAVKEPLKDLIGYCLTPEELEKATREVSIGLYRAPGDFEAAKRSLEGILGDQNVGSPQALAAAVVSGLKPALAATIPVPPPEARQRATSPELGRAAWEIAHDDIELFDKIGEGTFGNVYRGRLWGTDVAVKTVKPECISPEVIDDLKNEIGILSRLRHPNIVLYMGGCTKPPHICIVTEFMTGSVFEKLHCTTELVDMTDVTRMALECALGMAYLHEQRPKILHRDLKSLNLLMDGNGTVKICDFGLSLPMLSAHGSGMAGTSQWMAPEVVNEQKYDEKVDVYSFGVVLCELVARQLPVDGGQFHDVEAFVRGAGDPDGGERTPAAQSLFGPLAGLIDGCLSIDPKKRPSFHSIVHSLRSLKKLRKEREMDLTRIEFWLSLGDPRLHEVGFRQIAWLDGAALKEAARQFLRRMVSLLWRVEGPPFLHCLIALKQILRDTSTLERFVAMDGVPLMVSRLATDDPEPRMVLLDIISSMASTGGGNMRELLREALLGLGMLKQVFLLQSEYPAASSLLKSLSLQRRQRSMTQQHLSTVTPSKYAEHPAGTSPGSAANVAELRSLVDFISSQCNMLIASRDPHVVDTAVAELRGLADTLRALAPRTPPPSPMPTPTPIQAARARLLGSGALQRRRSSLPVLEFDPAAPPKTPRGRSPVA